MNTATEKSAERIYPLGEASIESSKAFYGRWDDYYRAILTQAVLS